MMGVGKTSVGKHLAHVLDRAFVDTDSLVVAARGQPIGRIFADEGEGAFRRYEYEAVCAALAGEPAVIATGGGCVTVDGTRRALAAGARRVYLEMAPRAILLRLRRSNAVRPIAGSTPTLERVEALLAAREPFYREAEFVVRCDGRSRAQLANAIAELLAQA
jgi:shikimate kinase